MSTILNKATNETDTGTATDVKSAANDDALIKDAIDKIRHHQHCIGRATLDKITHLMRIGRELNDLHSQIPHGGWEDIVQKEVGLNKATGNVSIENLPTPVQGQLRKTVRQIEKLRTMCESNE